MKFRFWNIIWNFLCDFCISYSKMLVNFYLPISAHRSKSVSLHISIIRFPLRCDLRCVFFVKFSNDIIFSVAFYSHSKTVTTKCDWFGSCTVDKVKIKFKWIIHLMMVFISVSISNKTHVKLCCLSVSTPTVIGCQWLKRHNGHTVSTPCTAKQQTCKSQMSTPIVMKLNMRESIYRENV